MPEYLPLANQGWPTNLIAWKATIGSGASVSEMIPTQGKALVGILMPAAWTAADIGLKTCLTGSPSSLVPVYDNGGNVQKTPAAADRFIAFPLNNAVFGPWIQLTSLNTASGAAENQGAARELILVFRNYLD